jgi:hypothetical protein
VCIREERGPSTSIRCYVGSVAVGVAASSWMVAALEVPRCWRKRACVCACACVAWGVAGVIPAHRGIMGPALLCPAASGDSDPASRQAQCGKRRLSSL